MLNIIQLFQDYRIDYATEGHHHCHSGWVQINCPFCYGKGHYTLGYEINTQRWHCWRCGGHSKHKVGKTLTGIPNWFALEQKYGTTRPVRTIAPPKKTKNREKCKLPTGIIELNKQHRRYLLSRKFIPQKIQQLWGIRGFGPVGEYKFRLFIPIVKNRNLVSYQTRDTTGKAQNKYLSCPKQDELYPQKKWLYGMDEAYFHYPDGIIVTEGVTDVWRFGYGTVCTFGVDFSLEQARLLATHWQTISIVFDPEPTAQKRAYRLANAIACLQSYREIEVVEIDASDPGGMNQTDADKLKRELLGDR